MTMEAVLEVMARQRRHGPPPAGRSHSSHPLGSGAMSGFDAATAAVEGALAAGARYADARVMYRRTESMSAKNGDIEALTESEDEGLGVRALVGSSWGFFAVPDVGDAAARAAGPRAAEIAVRQRDGAGTPTSTSWRRRRRTASWASPCEIDPLEVPLSEKGDLLVEVTKLMKDGGADIAEAGYSIWDTKKWLVSSEGHRIDQHIRECGASSAATAVGDGETQRRSYPQLLRRLRHRRVGAGAVVRPRRQRTPDRRGGAALLTAPVVPGGRHDADPRRRPADPPDPRVGRSRHRARPHPRLGGGLRRDVSWLELPKLDSLRYGSDLMNITADATLPGALGIVRLRRRGHAGRSGSTSCGTGSGSACSPGATRPRSPGSTPAGSVRADGLTTGSRWCG